MQINELTHLDAFTAQDESLYDAAQNVEYLDMVGRKAFVCILLWEHEFA